jgi:Sugar transferases involved in lipopolysaccharide synthesis
MEFSDSERKIMAGYIAEDNLDYVNTISEPVNYKETIYEKYVKRLFDIIISFAVLLITLPINLIIAIVTYFDVGSPILFHQKRIGLNCQEFEMIKFRNMTNETNDKGELLPPKDRVTKWGNFVRKTSLDELLNFWCILKGDMSVIGPRPLVTSYMDRYSERHKKRHCVKPGLECPYIMNNNPTGNKWQDQFENDIWYVENISFITDLRMIVGLVKLVFNRKESSKRGKSNRGGFMGYTRDGIAINGNSIPEVYIERLNKEKGLNKG